MTKTKNKPKQGDILLCHNYGLFGLYVRLATKSYWNHCALYIGNNQVIDILGRGIRVLDYTKYYENKVSHKFIRVKGLSEYKIKQVCEHAKTFIGRRYNFLLPFGIYNQSGAYTCSDFITKVFSDNGITLYTKSLMVSPADLNESDRTYDIDNPPNRQKEIETIVRIIKKTMRKHNMTLEEFIKEFEKPEIEEK